MKLSVQSLYCALIVLLFGLTLVGCGSKQNSLPPPSPETSAPSESSEPPAVNRHELLEDFDFLCNMICENYCYIPVAERITGQNFETVQEVLRGRIDFVRSEYDFYKNIVVPLTNSFGYAGHMMTLDASAYIAELQLNSDAETASSKSDYLYNILNNPQSRRFYTEILGATIPAGLLSVTAASVQPLPQELSVVTSLTDQVPPYTFEDGNIFCHFYPQEDAAYVKITTFSMNRRKEDIQALKRFFATAEKEGYQNCIIDISENGGGSDYIWRAGIVEPNLKNEVTASQLALTKGALAKEYLQVYGAGLKSLDSLFIKSMPALNPDDLNGVEEYVELSRTLIPSEEAPLFSGKFWLLVGPDVYSSSEALAIFCKDTGFATVIGTQTGGDGIGIDPIVVALPNSGICVRFSAMMGLNHDGSVNEEIGTTPDIVLSTPSVSECLDVIKSTYPAT